MLVIHNFKNTKWNKLSLNTHVTEWNYKDQSCPECPWGHGCPTHPASFKMTTTSPESNWAVSIDALNAQTIQPSKSTSRNLCYRNIPTYMQIFSAWDSTFQHYPWVWKWEKPVSKQSHIMQRLERIMLLFTTDNEQCLRYMAGEGISLQILFIVWSHFLKNF